VGPTMFCSLKKICLQRSLDPSPRKSYHLSPSLRRCREKRGRCLEQRRDARMDPNCDETILGPALVRRREPRTPPHARSAAPRPSLTSRPPSKPPRRRRPRSTAWEGVFVEDEELDCASCSCLASRTPSPSRRVPETSDPRARLARSSGSRARRDAPSATSGGSSNLHGHVQVEWMRGGSGIEFLQELELRFTREREGAALHAQKRKWAGERL
jgi:hypothetical protein